MYLFKLNGYNLIFGISEHFFIDFLRIIMKSAIKIKK